MLNYTMALIGVAMLGLQIGFALIILAKVKDKPAFYYLHPNSLFAPNNRYWMQDIKMHHDQYRKSVANRYGADGFNSRTGDIKTSIINKDIHSSNPQIVHEATLARTFNNYRK